MLSLSPLADRYGVLSLSLAETDSAALAAWIAPRDTIKTNLPLWKKALGVDELLYVATCNRVFFLFTAHNAPSVRSLRHRIQSIFGCDHDAPWRSMLGPEAITHIFEVASGLHSAVRGEREIAVQLEVAWRRARCARTSMTLIDLLLRNALAVATQIAVENERPAPSLADWVVPEITARRAGAPVALFGSSSLMQLCGRRLRAAGHRVFAVSRSADRAQRFAEASGGEAMTLQAMLDEPQALGALVMALGASTETFGCEQLAAFERAVTIPPIIVDLGLPPNVARDAADRRGERYLPLTHFFRLSAGAHELLAAREAAVRTGVERFFQQLAVRDAGPVLGAWRRARLQDADRLSTEQRAAGAAVHREIHHLKQIVAVEGVASLQDRLRREVMAA